jgi:hypothetical protein
MRRHALQVAFAALLGALAIIALPVLAGAKDRGHDRSDDGQHHSHHHNAFDRDEDTGTISAFDTTSGKLTIALFGGDSISGLVSSRTDVRCEGPDDHSRFSRDSGNSGPGSGDDNGSRGELEPGDDHGEAVESGDDNGDHGNGRICSTDDLVVGAVVHEADLDLKRGIARFDEIELGHSS